MAAIVVTEHGASPVLAELPLPQPRAGEALIKVTAAALNNVDLALASGRFFAPMPPPYVPGVEGRGRVVRSEAFEPGSQLLVAANCAEAMLGCNLRRRPKCA